MHTLKNIQITHYSQNILTVVSKELISQYHHLLPDFSEVTIFLPNLLAQMHLREEILNQAGKIGYDAIFPPEITTLQSWCRKQNTNKKPVLSQYARELILVDAIKQQPDLFAHANPWGIANELLSLFDAMLLSNVKPLDFNTYYQGHKPDLTHALLHESDLVKVLWEAWREQTSDENFIDPVEAYASVLKSVITSNEDIFYCVGLDKLTNLECDFLNRISKESEVLFYAYGTEANFNNRTDLYLKKYVSTETQTTVIETSDKSPFTVLLDTVFEVSDQSIKQRAETYIENYPDDSFSNKLNTYKTNKFEQHCNAIDIQIRIWLHENLNKIGVVTTDRKLARRLRAILEHANITVNDDAGWALATTSAAVVVEWWLQLIEEQYPSRQLIALAKSPFFPKNDPDLHHQAVNYFEKEIILKFNIHNGIHRYRNAIEKIQSSKNNIDENIPDYLIELLDKFENSSQLLAKLHSYEIYSLHSFIYELINSLKPIGIYTRLNQDDAGKQIIELFKDQINHFKLIDNHMNWSECRRFISRIFDQQNYKPPKQNNSDTHNVTFCSLEQSRLQKFDALIIASVDKAHFPGTANNYVFFNEQVRSELGIPTWRDDQARYLHQFRCLLDSAENILITVQTERNGEKTTPCPWLEAIETFHYMAYGKSLSNQQLEYLVNDSHSQVQKESELPNPEPSAQPNPIPLAEIKPNQISISDYQRLVDCPYQYFALTCLKLLPTQELQEELTKADFGSLVHQCIHTFFAKVPNYPDPITEKITQENREQCITQLNDISQKVFSQSDSSQNNEGFHNQLWLQRWLSLIPSFIDWEIKRQFDHKPMLHEKKVELNFDNANVYGRLDRVDKSTDGYSIIDYKTGQTPSKISVLSGEQVQLPMYALLNDSDENTSTRQVEYVSIGDKNTVRSIVSIKENDLDELKQQHLARLRSFFEDLNKDVPFTALASDETCQRCDAFGVCRKSFWQN